MEDPMEHERMRFKSMTIKQLITRLGRIKDPSKLQRFIIVADEHAYVELKIVAQNRLRQLIFNPDSLRYEAMQNPIPKTSKLPVKPTKTKVETPVVLRRHLEF